MRKKSHLAYWVRTSFNAIEFTRHGKIKGYFLGAHEPRNLKNVPKIGGKPRLKDLKAKADIVVLDNGNLESFPFFAEDIPRFVSAINSLTPTRDFADEAILLAHRDHTLAQKNGRTNYVEQNFHNINEDGVLSKIDKLYKYNLKDPYYRLKDIDWLKDSLITLDRDITNSKNEITGTIHQGFAVGFDKRYNMPIIGFRKSYGNFVSIIPLVDKGQSLINSLVYTAYHKPPTRYITKDLYERTLVKCNLLFNNYTLLHVDFINLSFNQLKVKINGG